MVSVRTVCCVNVVVAQCGQWHCELTMAQCYQHDSHHRSSLLAGFLLLRPANSIPSTLHTSYYFSQHNQSHYSQQSTLKLIDAYARHVERPLITDKEDNSNGLVMVISNYHWLNSASRVLISTCSAPLVQMGDTVWPWPLTYNIELQCQASQGQGRPSCQNQGQRSNGSNRRAPTDKRTDTKTDATKCIIAPATRSIIMYHQCFNTFVPGSASVPVFPTQFSVVIHVCSQTDIICTHSHIHSTLYLVHFTIIHAGLTVTLTNTVYITQTSHFFHNFIF